MFCERCGAELEENTRFCSTCGNPVGEGAAFHAGNPLWNKKVLTGILGVFVLSGGLSGAVWWLARSGKVQDPSGSYVLEGDSELPLELMRGGKCRQWRGSTGRPCTYSIEKNTIMLDLFLPFFGEVITKGIIERDRIYLDLEDRNLITGKPGGKIKRVYVREEMSATR